MRPNTTRFRQYSYVMQRRPDIEGLRAVAVLSVLLFHAGVPALSGGYVGVDVFFVVSGFLITSLLVNERSESGRISLADFYSRRARRILPVSSVVAVATLVASWVWLEPLRLRTLATDVLGVATFSSNIVFAGRGADYLQSSLPPSPLQHYWSLGVEEQFYLVWPLLLALVCWRAASRSDVVRRIGFVSLSVGVGSFLACMALMETSQPWAFFSPHTRAFELAAGAFVAVLPAPRSRVVSVASAVAAWIGLLGVAATVVVFNESTRFPGPWALVPVAATAILLRGGNCWRFGPSVLLGLSPLQWLGSRSYSAYLWHWPILIVGAAAVSRSLTVGEGLACTALALVLSELSFRIVENPIRLNRAIAGRRALSLATALIAIVAGAGVLARNNPPEIAGAGAAETPELGATSTTLAPSMASSTTVAVPTAPTLPPLSSPLDPIVKAVSITGLPSNLTPSLTTVFKDKPSIYDDGCHANFSTTVPKNCVFGDPSSTTVVGLFGDSHAAEWFPAFAKVAKDRKWKLITYTKRGCPPVDIATYSKVLGKVYTECGPWRTRVLKKMETDGVRVVFVAHFDRLLSAQTRLPMWQKEWREALQRTIVDLRGRNITPVLVEDTPFPGQDIPTCLSANYTNVSNCAPVVSSAYRGDMQEMRRDFVNDGVPVLWVRNWFCSESVCPPIVGNILVYRDDNHMTVRFAEFLAPVLSAAVGDFVSWYSSTTPSTSP